MVLRSKEPSICWKNSGEVSFITISEHSGPNQNDMMAPLTFRMRLNLTPPAALPFHLNSQAVRYKLGLHANSPVIANSPTLEVMALPEEIGKFGKWMVEWLDAQFRGNDVPPDPPVSLISWTWVDHSLETLKSDITSIGKKWMYHNYLWTPSALEQFDTFLKQASSDTCVAAETTQSVT